MESNEPKNPISTDELKSLYSSPPLSGLNKAFRDELKPFAASNESKFAVGFLQILSFLAYGVSLRPARQYWQHVHHPSRYRPVNIRNSINIPTGRSIIFSSRLLLRCSAYIPRVDIYEHQMRHLLIRLVLAGKKQNRSRCLGRGAVGG